MKLDFKKIKIDKKKVGFLRFGKLGDKYLITNELGSFRILNVKDFTDFLEGKIDENSELYIQLRENGFTKDAFSLEKIKGKYVVRNGSLFNGTSLHIIVGSLRCNTHCVYCQASSRPMDSYGYDMDEETAKKAVDLIFQSPSPSITIEFQGGEPLANWPIVEFIINYTNKKKKEKEFEDKKVGIVMVSNFSLMTEDKLNFLIDNMISLCTSLDGPENIHIKNRPLPGKNSYKEVTKWIKKIKSIEKEKQNTGKEIYRLSALLTITRETLKYPKEVVKEYQKWGFNGIHLRPLSYLGYSGGKIKDKIGYSTDEFMDFWKKSMDYIISLNLEGTYFIERGTRILLQKILTDVDPGYTDLRSPCGAVTGQLLYNYDGKIYTCDEGRMTGDDTFLVGNIDNDYDEIIWNEKTKTMIAASTLDNLSCDLCVYKPYCGVCPVKNYVLCGNLFPQMRGTEWCELQMAQFEYIFDRIQDDKIMTIFKRWLKRGNE